MWNHAVHLLLFITLTSLVWPTRSLGRNSCLRAGTKNVTEQGFVQQFLAEFESPKKAAVPQKESLRYIESALSGNSSGFKLYVEMTLSNLKELNDSVFKNKALVTAITNLHKKYFVVELNRFQRKNPQISLLRFSNFKSVSLELNGEVGPQQIKELKGAFQRANQSFFNDARIQRLLKLYRVSETDSWFNLGLGGNTEGQTAAATRVSKRLGLNTANYYSSEVQSFLKDSRQNVLNKHLNLTRALRGTGMLTRENLLKLDFFVVARKLPKQEQGETTKTYRLRKLRNLREALHREFPNSRGRLKQRVLEEMLEYVESADIFSASLLTTAQLKDVKKTEHGILFIDFVGLGAENLKATTDSVLKSESVSHAIQLSREAEQAVTNNFKARIEKIKRSLREHFQEDVDFMLSGDEFFILPRKQVYVLDALHLLDQVTQDHKRPYIRLAVNRGSATGEQSKKMLSYGEHMEKILRHSILKTFGRDFTKKSHIGVSVLESKTNKKELEIYVLLRVQRRFRPEQKKLLSELIHQSMVNLSQKFNNNESGHSFIKGEHYLIDGAQKDAS